MTSTQLAQVHSNIAADLCRTNVWALCCAHCGNSREISEADFLHYLHVGLPVCCKATMALAKVSQ